MPYDLIQRLLVARETQHIPPDLADELLRVLPTAFPALTCAGIRDSLLRAAATHIPGCTEQKARALAAMIGRARRPTDEVRALIHHARRFRELPTSTRMLRRILEK